MLMYTYKLLIPTILYNGTFCHVCNLMWQELCLCTDKTFDMDSLSLLGKTWRKDYCVIIS